MTKSINLINGVLNAINAHGNALCINGNNCTIDGNAHSNKFTVRTSDFYTSHDGNNIHFSYCDLDDDARQNVMDFLVEYNASKSGTKKTAVTRKTKKSVDVVVLTAYKTIDDYKTNNEYAKHFLNARTTSKREFLASIQSKIDELVMQRKAEASFWDGVNGLDDKQADLHLLDKMTAHNKDAEVAERAKTRTTTELAVAVVDLEAEVARLKAELAQAQAK